MAGGAGFLGSHLIDRLLDQGHVCVDNLFTGDKANIEYLHGHSRFEFLLMETIRYFQIAAGDEPVIPIAEGRRSPQ